MRLHTGRNDVACRLPGYQVEPHNAQTSAAGIHSKRAYTDRCAGLCSRLLMLIAGRTHNQRQLTAQAQALAEAMHMRTSDEDGGLYRCPRRGCGEHACSRYRMS